LNFTRARLIPAGHMRRVERECVKELDVWRVKNIVREDTLSGTIYSNCNYIAAHFA